MLKNLCAGCLGLSALISAQFNLEMCAAAKNCKDLLKPAILGVQGRSRSSMLIPSESSSPYHQKGHHQCLLSLVESLCLYTTIFTRESSYYFQHVLAIAILFICPSITRVDQSKTVQARIIKSSPSAAWKTLVLETVKLFHKFEGGYPERGR